MTNFTKSALWMIAAILSFSCMALAGREAMSGYNTFEIMTYRSAVGVIVVCAILIATRNTQPFKTNRLPFHLVRNITHFTGQNLWFYALSLVPMAQVVALEFTSPIWLILLAPVFLGEKLTPIRLLAVALAFIGVICVVHPDVTALNIGTFAAASCAIFFALTIVATKRLTTTEDIITIMFWLTLMQLGFGLILTLWDGQIEPLHWEFIPYLVIIGLSGLAAHYCLSTALSLAPAAEVVPFDFARLPLIACLGAIFYGESVDFWLFVGGFFILLGNYINIAYSQQQAATH